ncbi:hypothetical protein LTR36_007774 [Oleoguttula mirabilis]|uniref:Uncharacterized protein n=1 Tax=Oleoguttula mirabilis TaxID=1507867 RepID=A0AAV9J9K4_9PEZI|nr:hypothetical protein LTR36_007774 [Oleoguttula mirabilis]
MSTSWLQRQRKQTLIDLSSEAGLQQVEDARKDEIVDALDTYLQQHVTRLSRNNLFEPYYAVRRTPFKVRSSSAMPGVTSDDGEVKSVVRGRGRRATRVKEELEFVTRQDVQDACGEANLHHSQHYGPVSSPVATSSRTVATTSTTVVPSATSSLLTKRTPGRPSKRESQILPPSPADVANLAEYETNQVYAGLNDMYSVSGIPESIDNVRDICSSVTGVQMAFLLLEAIALSREVIPWVYAFEIAGIRGYGMPTIAVYYPDLFKLLTSDFWLPTLLWSATSLLIPSLFAYFFNLTIREVKRHGALVSVARYTVDPLTFNIVKALLTWMVYGKGIGFGIIDPFTAITASNAMFGGYNGVLIGCYVCIVASVYEAAQRN